VEKFGKKITIVWQQAKLLKEVGEVCWNTAVEKLVETDKAVMKMRDEL
jgi:hypothetical protein